MHKQLRIVHIYIHLCKKDFFKATIKTRLSRDQLDREHFGLDAKYPKTKVHWISLLGVKSQKTVYPCVGTIAFPLIFPTVLSMVGNKKKIFNAPSKSKKTTALYASVNTNISE